jgi:hypothetical protein
VFALRGLVRSGAAARLRVLGNDTARRLEARIDALEQRLQGAIDGIAITQTAFDAVAKSLPFCSVMYEARPTRDGERFIWVEQHAVVQLDLMRGPGESYSDMIIRLCEIEGAKPGRRRKGMTINMTSISVALGVAYHLGRAYQEARQGRVSEQAKWCLIGVGMAAITCL